MNGLRARVQIQVPRSFDRRTGELNGLLCVLLVLLQDFISGRLRWCLWILDVPTLNATEIRFERAFGHPESPHDRFNRLWIFFPSLPVIQAQFRQFRSEEGRG